ncbi:hypothetical protein MMC25_007927 [Agyrium rufum]|nr:hypothetical protein [Agyrium rufum]
MRDLKPSRLGSVAAQNETQNLILKGDQADVILQASSPKSAFRSHSTSSLPHPIDPDNPLPFETSLLNALSRPTPKEGETLDPALFIRPYPSLPYDIKTDPITGAPIPSSAGDEHILRPSSPPPAFHVLLTRSIGQGSLEANASFVRGVLSGMVLHYPGAEVVGLRAVNMDGKGRIGKDGKRGVGMDFVWDGLPGRGSGNEEDEEGAEEYFLRLRNHLQGGRTGQVNMGEQSGLKRILDDDLVLVIEAGEWVFQLPPDVLIGRWLRMVRGRERNLGRRYGTRRNVGWWEKEGKRKRIEKIAERVIWGAIQAGSSASQAKGGLREGSAEKSIIPQPGVMMGTAHDVLAIVNCAVGISETWSDSKHPAPAEILMMIWDTQEGRRLAHEKSAASILGRLFGWFSRKGDGSMTTSQNASTTTPASEDHEFSVGLDDRHLLFQPVTPGLTGSLSTTTSDYALPKDILLSRPPLPTAHIDDYKYTARSFLPPYEASLDEPFSKFGVLNGSVANNWSSVPLRLNLATDTIPALLYRPHRVDIPENPRRPSQKGDDKSLSSSDPLQLPPYPLLLRALTREIIRRPTYPLHIPNQPLPPPAPSQPRPTAAEHTPPTINPLTYDPFAANVLLSRQGGPHGIWTGNDWFIPFAKIFEIFANSPSSLLPAKPQISLAKQGTGQDGEEMNDGTGKAKRDVSSSEGTPESARLAELVFRDGKGAYGREEGWQERDRMWNYWGQQVTGFLGETIDAEVEGLLSVHASTKEGTKGRGGGGGGGGDRSGGGGSGKAKRNGDENAEKELVGKEMVVVKTAKGAWRESAGGKKGTFEAWSEGLIGEGWGKGERWYQLRVEKGEL